MASARDLQFTGPLCRFVTGFFDLLSQNLAGFPSLHEILGFPRVKVMYILRLIEIKR